MRLHTVIVSFNRLELLQRTVESYLATVQADWSAEIVDNGSDQQTRRWLRQQQDIPVRLLRRNRYPGYATNRGFAHAPADVEFLHRSDSDMEYLPDWCEEMRRSFINERVGQVGLRTSAEELYCTTNVGGTAVFRKSLWDAGLRYREASWHTLGTVTEDYWISVEVEKMGWRWTRVTRPCVIHLGSGDLTDPYYQHSYGVRGIT